MNSESDFSALLHSSSNNQRVLLSPFKHSKCAAPLRDPAGPMPPNLICGSPLMPVTEAAHHTALLITVLLCTPAAGMTVAVLMPPAAPSTTAVCQVPRRANSLQSSDLCLEPMMLLIHLHTQHQAQRMLPPLLSMRNKLKSTHQNMSKSLMQSPCLRSSATTT